MADYKIQHVDADFKMTAFGVSFDDFNDWAGNTAKTAARKAEVTADGSLDALLKKADGQLYEVNYLLNGKAWRGFGVKGAYEAAGAEQLDFLAGDYLVIPGTGDSVEQLPDQIIGQFFGGLAQQITDYKYVGPGNYAFAKEEGGKAVGELWLRAEKQ